MSASAGRAEVNHVLLRTFSTTDQGGYQPENSLLLASDGALYGTTYAGGTNNYGTVFKVNPDGTGFTNLYRFQSTLISPADGWGPRCKLIEGVDGMLYGTTRNGGSGGNRGTVFKLNKDGSGYEVLRSFTSGTDAQNPVDGVVQGSDGWLYGSAYAGGSAARGAVFKLNTNGSGYQVLRSFLNLASDGQYPNAGIIEASDGVLYGATVNGGTNGYGTIFKLNRDGTDYGVLHFFGDSSPDGRNPYASLMEATNGVLYGATQNGGTNGYGTLFKLDKTGANYAVIHTFTGGALGGQGGFAELTQGKDGSLYGTTRNGGSNNQGTAFKVNLDGSGFQVLFSFTGTGGIGNTPFGTVIQDGDGNLYGTTRNGGGQNAGTVFKLTAPPVIGPTLSIVPAGAGQAMISWMPATPGFGLQETWSLSPANWTNSPSGATNPVTVSSTNATKFYRLFKP